MYAACQYNEDPMLFPRHPQPVVPPKAVATQVVRQRQQHKAVDKHVLVVDKPAPPPPPQPAKD
jgi:hypothetical protein